MHVIFRSVYSVIKKGDGSWENLIYCLLLSLLRACANFAAAAAAAASSDVGLSLRREVTVRRLRAWLPRELYHSLATV